jgi:proteasome assembly chaperone (PAC2) family protein
MQSFMKVVFIYGLPSMPSCVRIPCKHMLQDLGAQKIDDLCSSPEFQLLFPWNDVSPRQNELLAHMYWLLGGD